MQTKCLYEKFATSFGIQTEQENVISNFKAWFNEVATKCHETAIKNYPISGYDGRLCFRVGITYIADFYRIPEETMIYVANEDDDYIGDLIRSELQNRPMKYMRSAEHYFIIFSFRRADGKVHDALLPGKYKLGKNPQIKTIFDCDSSKVHIEISDSASVLYISSLRSLKSLAKSID